MTIVANDIVDVDRNPGLLLELESRIRDVTGKRLEIYLQEKQDGNRIRRIKLD